MTSNTNDNSEVNTPIAARVSQVALGTQRTGELHAKSLHGKERYLYLLKRKTIELDNLRDRKSDKEATYYTITVTRAHKEQRDAITRELDELDVAIIEVQEQVNILQQRVQSYEQVSQSWSTPARPMVSTASHMAPPATAAVSFSTPAPRPLFTDPFSNTILPPPEEPTELNPKQFIVPSNLPTFRYGETPIQDIEIFTHQFELSLIAHGLSHNKSWSRLLPLCLPFEMQEWLHRTHPSSHTWAQVRASLHHQYGNPTKRRAAVVKIYTAKQQPDESVIDFMQRLMKLMRQAQAQYDNQDMVDYLLEQLPTDLAIQLESAVQYGRIHRSVLDMESFARSFPGVYTKKRIPGPTNKVASSTKPSSQKTLYCETHGKCYHTTAQCKFPKKGTLHTPHPSLLRLRSRLYLTSRRAARQPHPKRCRQKGHLRATAAMRRVTTPTSALLSSPLSSHVAHGFATKTSTSHIMIWPSMKFLFK